MVRAYADKVKKRKYKLAEKYAKKYDELFQKGRYALYFLSKRDKILTYKICFRGER